MQNKLRHQLLNYNSFTRAAAKLLFICFPQIFHFLVRSELCGSNCARRVTCAEPRPDASPQCPIQSPFQTVNSIITTLNAFQQLP